MDDDKALIGKTIIAVEISDSRESIYFTTSDCDKLWYMAEGDCCSQSWIEHFDCEALIGATVIDVFCKYTDEYIENGILPTKFPDFQQDYDQVYFYEIVTYKGSETLEMRNSSNGYYGGWMSRCF